MRSLIEQIEKGEKDEVKFSITRYEYVARKKDENTIEIYEVINRKNDELNLAGIIHTDTKVVQTKDRIFALAIYYSTLREYYAKHIKIGESEIGIYMENPTPKWFGRIEYTVHLTTTAQVLSKAFPQYKPYDPTKKQEVYFTFDKVEPLKVHELLKNLKNWNGNENENGNGNENENDEVKLVKSFFALRKVHPTTLLKKYLDKKRLYGVLDTRYKIVVSTPTAKLVYDKRQKIIQKEGITISLEALEFLPSLKKPIERLAPEIVR